MKFQTFDYTGPSDTTLAPAPDPDPRFDADVHSDRDRDRDRDLVLPAPLEEGRPTKRQSFANQIRYAETTFANAMGVESERYIEELAPKDPERCPFHGGILGCLDDLCDYTSQRTSYNFAAAQYIFNRIMGKPGTQGQTLGARVMQDIATALVRSMIEVNDIEDKNERITRFTDRISDFIALFSSGRTPTESIS